MNNETKRTILNETSICTMSIETTQKLDSYYDTVELYSERVDLGRCTLKEAIDHIRSMF